MLAAASSHASFSSPDTHRVIFLGTPQVAALVLQKLLSAARHSEAAFDVAAVVSQPSRPKGRNRIPQPSPVEVLAREAGIPDDLILLPERASESSFLDTIRALAPDLCITAAYGNYLPSRFLSIPRFGTLNIHPSLLPAYRGAAPVQRSLQDGVPITGVSVLYTVKEMDAGPVLAKREVLVDPNVQAPELLPQLFDIGTDLLLESLPAVWAGKGPSMAIPQDVTRVTQATKISREEGLLDFRETAVTCHNKVRAFAGWPGTFFMFFVENAQGTSVEGKGLEPLDLKILKTQVKENIQRRAPLELPPNSGVVDLGSRGLEIVCGDGAILEVLEVQAPGRRAVLAKDFANGLKGRKLLWQVAS